LLPSADASADSFFDIYVDLWNSGQVSMSPVNSGTYPFPPPPLPFPDLDTAAGIIDIQLESLSLRSSAPMLVSPPDLTGRFVVDSFFDIAYSITATDSNGTTTHTVDSFFDIAYKMEVAPSSSSADGATFDTEMISMDLTGIHPIPLNGGGAMHLGLKLVEGQPSAFDGHVTVLKLAGGGNDFSVDSFFDVFVELSVDGGSTYHQSTLNSQLRLLSQNQVTIPEPS
jgi:hypothetical protein